MAQWQSGDVTANGIKIHYTRTGGGRTPLVLNHGATDNGLCWTPVAKAFEAEYDVVMPDARGHGFSDAPTEGYGTAERAADLAGLIEALRLDRPFVGGHSMGAGTALRFAADYPGMLRGAILEDPGFRAADAPARPGGPRQMVLQHKEKTRDELIAHAREAHPAWGEDELGPWADSKLQVSVNFGNAPRAFPERPDFRELLPKVRVPVLLITADPDRGGIVTPEVAAEAQRLLPSLTVARLSGAGHNVRREQFGRFLEVVHAFLKENA
jgi:pimeloyl-ACP methyl ester carboxylesterase